MARMVLDHDESCEVCEQTLSPYQGPAVAHRYEYPVRDVAIALVRVGRGMSYTEAAARSRARTRRGNVISSQLVGNWVEVFAPVIAASFPTPDWPETVVLDATNFYAPMPGVASARVFDVLCATGYEQGATEARVLALRAVTRANKRSWTAFMKSRPGQPTLVISDEDTSLLPTVPQVWSTATLRLCRWHLCRNLAKQLVALGIRDSDTNPITIAARGAFDDLASWRKLKSAVKRRGGADIKDWVANHDYDLLAEFAGGPLPTHFSNGSAEMALQQVRRVLERRAFCFRNAERTNRLLELVRLRLNKQDDEGHYAAVIRHHLEAGHPLTPQLTVTDVRGSPSLRP